MSKRLKAAAILSIALGVLTAQPMAAAIDVAVSVSPTAGVVNSPVDVLVRTFVPVNQNEIDLPRPSLAYPVPSGVWDVLYPVDYPFEVIARSPTGDEVQIALVRDGVDASLWRGSFTPTVPGEWWIVMANFPTYAPIRLTVLAAATIDLPGVNWALPVAALMLGLLGGVLLARVPGRTVSVSFRGRDRASCLDLQPTGEHSRSMKTTRSRLVRVAAAIIVVALAALFIGFAVFAYSVSRPVLG